MTKQEFMDKEKKSIHETNILQLMLGMSKTQLLTLQRHLKMAHKSLYTTAMRSVTMESLMFAVDHAWEFMENDKIDNYEPNKMENKK